MPRRALITGGTGFIAYHLARALVDLGAEVTLVDNGFRSRRDGEVDALLAGGRATLATSDLTRPGALDDVGSGYDEVYHLAAMVGVRYANEIPARVLRSNLLMTINVLDWMPSSGAGRLLYSSTSEVYAATVDRDLAPVPTPEDVLLSVGNGLTDRYSYGLSKIAGEMLVRQSAARDGYEHVTVRLHNVYGPRMGHDHVVPEVIDRIREREDPFRVYGADQRRAFCYVDDAVEAILALMSAPGAAGQVVNVGNDAEETQILALVRLLFELTGYSAQLEPVAAPPGSVARRCPDLTRLRALVGRQTLTPLRDGLRRTADWYARSPRAVA